tara:strand:+ start:634 stop:744 length:111 start_codon:yes stop_codon:yes gene_type:complete
MELMKQNGQIDKDVPAEAKKLDAQGTRSLEHGLRQS